MHPSQAHFNRQDSDSDDAEGSSGRANDRGAGKDGEKKGVINRVNSEHCNTSLRADSQEPVYDNSFILG